MIFLQEISLHQEKSSTTLILCLKIAQLRYGEQLSKDVLWDALVATAKKRETLEQIETEDIVLDCNLPDGTGFSFCVIICYQIFLPLYFPLSEFVNTGGTI